MIFGGRHAGALLSRWESKTKHPQTTTYTGMNLAWAAVMKWVTALISPLAPLWNPWRKRLYEMRYAVMASMTFRNTGHGHDDNEGTIKYIYVHVPADAQFVQFVRVVVCIHLTKKINPRQCCHARGVGRYLPSSGGRQIHTVCRTPPQTMGI